MMYTFYSLLTLVTCEQPSMIGNLTHLSNWYMWYGFDKRNSCPTVMILGILFCENKKKSFWAILLTDYIISYQGHIWFSLQNPGICLGCLALHWALLNYCDPCKMLFILSWSRSHAHSTYTHVWKTSTLEASISHPSFILFYPLSTK